MKRYAAWLIVIFGMGVTAFSANPGRRFYRVVSETNTAITAWSVAGDLTWTNATVGISYVIESTTNLGNTATSFWGAVEYGPITGLVMTSRVPQSDAPAPPPTNSMVLILGGAFMMGNSYSTDPYEKDVPAHTMQIGSFYMDSTEVTKGQWDDVVNWAVTNGYVFEDTAFGTDTYYPIAYVSWYDCVKWCNARSQKEGLPPVYFTNETHTAIFTNGQVDLSTACVDWNGNGYRLPTEAEWEKAARGVLFQNYYPWPSPGPTNEVIYLNPTNANYDYSGVAYPVASFPANAYGLFDMAGNVREWCWDYFDLYINFDDPTGPTNGEFRVTRGGDYNSDFFALRCSAREDTRLPSALNTTLGFRCVRNSQ